MISMNLDRDQLEIRYRKMLKIVVAIMIIGFIFVIGFNIFIGNTELTSIKKDKQTELASIKKDKQTELESIKKDKQNELESIKNDLVNILTKYNELFQDHINLKTDHNKTKEILQNKAYFCETKIKELEDSVNENFTKIENGTRVNENSISENEKRISENEKRILHNDLSALADFYVGGAPPFTISMANIICQNLCTNCEPAEVGFALQTNHPIGHTFTGTEICAKLDPLGGGVLQCGDVRHFKLKGDDWFDNGSPYGCDIGRGMDLPWYPIAIWQHWSTITSANNRNRDASFKLVCCIKN